MYKNINIFFYIMLIQLLKNQMNKFFKWLQQLLTSIIYMYGQ